MEGNIWIESDGLGKGCTAIFDVKLGISNESSVPKAPASPRHANFDGLKVLVMDENGLVIKPFSLQIHLQMCSHGNANRNAENGV